MRDAITGSSGKVSTRTWGDVSWKETGRYILEDQKHHGKINNTDPCIRTLMSAYMHASMDT